MNKLPYNELVSTIIRKKEDDQKRDKRRCVYYDNGYCYINFVNCYSSSHCNEYKDRNISLELKDKSSEQCKYIVNYYSKENRTTEFVKCALEINISDILFKNIVNDINKKGKSFINLNLKSKSIYKNFDKLYITQIYLKNGNNRVCCYVMRDKIYGLYKNSDIRFRFSIEGFDEKRVMTNKAKLLYELYDEYYGKVCIYKTLQTKY